MPPLPDPPVSPVEARSAAALLNRLRKNARHWGKWARRNGIECYRLYDRDIPEFPLAIDRYGDWVHAQSFAARWASVGDAEAAPDDDLAPLIAQALEVDPARVVLKTRAASRSSCTRAACASR
jgi:23S rRNA G2069 N7-methylase RlmK/C1962 C5-methylase RlmI